jgi:hypothetical protein
MNSTTLTTYSDEIIEDHGGYRHNRSTTDHIFRINEILERKYKYIEALCQLFIYFKIAYNSVRREVFYNIIIEFGIPLKW